ncbi:MAG: hypothetical protein EBT65_06155, partial [Actinobacteria bacterium]|nr:hypothetical protein [Actinomycetota bacterium]
TTAGSFQTTKPVAPVHLVYAGVVVKTSAGNGRVYVKVQNGYELDEIHDVLISSPANNEILTYETSSGLWKNKTAPATGVTSVTATAPLTGGTITSTGSIGIDQTALSVTQSQVTGLVTALSGTAKLASANTFTVGGHIINSEGASVKPLIIRGNSAQTANLQEWQSTASGTVTVASMTDSGLLTIQNLSSYAANIGGGSSTGVLSVYTGSASGVGLSVRAATSQTADLQQWQTSAGATSAAINNGGGIVTSNRLHVGSVVTVAGVKAQVTNATPTDIALVVKGAASQSANLMEWQNSGGTIMSYVTSAGVGRFEQLQVTSGYAQLRYSNSGGHLQMIKKTASVASPGADNGAIYFVAGTTTGTLKLVVRAGAAGAETTILDNIPQ